ncbi:cytochrome d ubiquinol oxidase subunit II [Simiduia sp. 21SJ11W-1]|uniref:cytochrome d ubiquinol oxidase subunit II n=1 Tax=Simiduia sp. 21SJ11W-1 TaxID=2909669 RepID=UPI0020A04D7A|nr:cytochrome d ubiquinol oxidase subunit II [Simiduia sp. 21SJ11W-1]UTA48959.1 cytochrome d ubiquinol oxidase subunit II [Simiduia sp. 21SJ11W-1]
MIMDISTLALVFWGLLGVAVFMYALLDGYDLGVGMLLSGTEAERDRMVASIGPFWDANETWLVLAVGILLIAFPSAHSVILRELYLPALALLVGLILRGVSFDFRAKAISPLRPLWDHCFRIGSALAALAQGYMLGRFVAGFESGLLAQAFAMLSALCVAAAYLYIGSAWLIMKTEGAILQRALRWLRLSGALTLLGLVFISAFNLVVRPEVAERWLEGYAMVLLVLLPLLGMGCLWFVESALAVLQITPECHKSSRKPFIGVVGLFLLAFIALGYSYFPYVIPGKMLAVDAASHGASLQFILWGVVIVLPMIIVYTVFSYRVFWGKSEDLRYY